MLVDFPENYKLWEHVKKADESKSVKTQKTHAGGGNERQDAYLYGHPMGRKKRFRSPADFYAHLYWLVTDEAGDSDNCSCKICTPEEFEEKKAPMTAKQEPLVKPEVKAEPVLRQPSLAVPRPSGQDIKPTPSPSTILPQTPQPRSLIKTVSHDQALDMLYGTFIFRQGELVWFNRGNAWGLGVITQRWRQGADQHAPRLYIIQPLSHPFAHPQAVTVSGDQNIRPWLAWSVPSFTCPALNGTRVTYDGADWHGIFNRKYGAGDFEVDGSILAAKAIDATYNTFSLASQQPTKQGAMESHWNGLYLGAEKIWAGDIVRIRADSGADVMVVHDIVELSRTSAFNQQVLEQSVTIVGDVYTLKPIAYSNVNNPLPEDTTNLPQRLVEDLRRRNLKTIPTRHTASTWRLVRQAARLEIRELKGRWYEATLVLPLLRPDSYEAEFRGGDIAEAGLRMNSRLDCHNVNGTPGNVPDNRKQDRVSALGKAVPSSTRMIEGSDPPQPTPATARQQQDVGGQMALDPVFDQASAQSLHHSEAAGALGQGVSNPGMDEFMDLDAIDGNGLPGFGQEYGY